jgi:hypothetical protein
VFSDPSIPGFKWAAGSKEAPLRYANLLPEPEMQNNLFLDRVVFWTNLTAHSDYDLVRMKPKKQGDSEISQFN